MDLLIFPLLVWNFMVFLLPGLTLALWLKTKRRGFPGEQAMAVVFAAGGTLGMASFWIYFASHRAGRFFSPAVGILCCFLLLRLAKAGAEWRELLRELRFPLTVTVLAASVYLALLYVVADPFATGLSLMNSRFFTAERPGDNIIPWIFADRIYHGTPVKPFCCGNWLSSDRPPLQAGALLYAWWYNSDRIVGLNYQVLASTLQASALCAVWSLLSVLRTLLRRKKQVLLLLAPAAFFFYNCVFEWPKLLAATFTLFALSMLFTGLVEDRPLDRFETLLGSTCLGLALMAHPGSVFSVALFVAVALFKRLLPVRDWALALAVLGCFLVPWSLYQKYVDPPGNRLLKMHLAGVHEIDGRGALQTIVERYETVDSHLLLLFKWQNIRELVGPRPGVGLGMEAARGALGGLSREKLEDYRILQREKIWNAIGILNYGWLAAVILLFLKQRPALPFTWWMLAAGVANLLLWSLVMFGPAQTLTEHSSYADLLLIMMCLCSFLLALPWWVAMLTVLLELLNVGVVWMSFMPRNPLLPIKLQPSMVAYAVVGVAAFLVYSYGVFRTSESARQSSYAG